MRRQEWLAGAFFLALLGWCTWWFAVRLGWPVISRLLWLLVALPIVVAALGALGRRLFSAERRSLRLLGLALFAAAAALLLWLLLHLLGLLADQTSLRDLGGA